jgi:hypothetical protein
VSTPYGSTDAIDESAWRGRLARLDSPDVEAVVLVQCDVGWLRPRMRKFRNDVDEAVMGAQLRRGPSLRITRILLHSLPLSVDGEGPELIAAFADWSYRLDASGALLYRAGEASPRVHRLIIRGDQPSAGIPDMVEVLENGVWSDPRAAAVALRTIATEGATTPLTGYDVDLAGPFGDADPSVHM